MCVYLGILYYLDLVPVVIKKTKNEGMFHLTIQVHNITLLKLSSGYIE